MSMTNQFEFDAHVPPDLTELAELLDRLGAAERASMSRVGLGRVGGASAHVLLHPSAADAAAEAGRLDISARLVAVPSGLEDRVFQVSRGELVSGLKLVGEGRILPVGMRRVWWQRGVLRAAAAAAVIGVSAVSALVLRNGAARSSESPQDVNVLTASFDTEMQTLLDLLEGASDTGVTEAGTGSDHSITDQLLEWESL